MTVTQCRGERDDLCLLDAFLGPFILLLSNVYNAQI